MATRVRVTRLANPRRRNASPRRRNRVAARANSHRRRNALGHFVKAKRNVKRAAANPRRHRRRSNSPKVVTRYRNRTKTVIKYRNRYVKANPRRKNRTHAKRRRNPALLVTLGALNPRKRRRKNPMAKKNRRRARRNPTTVTVRRNRRHTPRAHARRHSRRNSRRRNPVVFGQHMSATGLAKTTLGLLIGVTAAKLIPPMLPGSLTSSPAMRVIVTGVVAFLAGMAGNKVSPDIGSAVLLGGLAQTASQALNAFVPSIGSQIGLSGGRGMGMLVPGQFPMPSNPVNVAALAPAPAMVPVRGGGVSGWGQGRGIMAA